ncbi:MAG: hypothetical protein HQ568_00720 [Calditrichaeota bacterium]|nr:hypothetical protein [Calditrichota bacterium]
MNTCLKRSLTPILVFSVVWLICLVTGCAHNKQSPILEDLGDYEIVPLRVIAAIDSGSRIAVVNLSGIERIGRLTSVELRSVEEYNEAYNRIRSSSPEPGLLPSTGESVVVTLYPERSFNGIFVGFDYGSVICIKESSAGRIIRLKLENVRSVKTTGEVIEGKYLRKLTNARRIPYRTVIIMQNEDIEIRTATNNVRHIKVYQTKQRWTGMLFKSLIVIGFSVLTSAIIALMG